MSEVPLSSSPSPLHSAAAVGATFGEEPPETREPYTRAWNMARRREGVGCLLRLFCSRILRSIQREAAINPHTSCPTPGLGARRCVSWSNRGVGGGAFCSSSGGGFVWARCPCNLSNPGAGRGARRGGGRGWGAVGASSAAEFGEKRGLDAGRVHGPCRQGILLCQTHCASRCQAGRMRLPI